MRYTVEATAVDSSMTGELSFGEFRLDPANALLWRSHDRVALPPKPFEVLCCLIKQAGQLVTKDELLDTVWQNLHVTESSLSVSINALRVALGDDAKAPRYIETVMRRGYRFIAPISDALSKEAGWQSEATAQASPAAKQPRKDPFLLPEAVSQIRRMNVLILMDCLIINDPTSPSARGY